MAFILVLILDFGYKYLYVIFFLRACFTSNVHCEDHPTKETIPQLKLLVLERKSRKHPAAISILLRVFYEWFRNRQL